MSGQTYSGRAVCRVVETVAATILLLAGMFAEAKADESPDALKAAATTSTVKGDSSSSPQTSKAQQEHIQALIHDLGNPRFTARRTAANELRQIGAEAFDSLHAATEDADPEIAASANYLLRQIAVRWVQPEDSATVRTQLRQYGQENENARLQHVEQLARLPQNGGVTALCRIVRFDRSPIISRTAALAIIRPKDLICAATSARFRSSRRAIGGQHEAVRNLATPISRAATRPGSLDRDLEAAHRPRSGSTR